MAQSQSTTTTPVSSTDLDICVMRLARDAVMRGGNLLTSFQAYQADYLAAEMVGTQPITRSRARKVADPKAVTPTATATRAPRAAKTSTTTRAPRAAKTSTTTRTPRVAGALGDKMARVLGKIVSTPDGITYEALAKAITPRYMKPNEVGTGIWRLTEKGYITGTPKVGPFTATETGIEAVKTQPTSINAPRNRRAVHSTTTEGAQPQAQAG
jgi:hypothetical protein